MIVLLVLGVCAAWLGWRLLYAHHWSDGLHVRVEFTDAWVYEGDGSCLKEEIVNDKVLPVPALEVRLSVSRNLEFQSAAKENTSVTDQTYKRDIFSLMSRQKIVRRLPFSCRRRGYYEIRTAGVAASDLLTGRNYLTDQSQNSAMYVYPAQVDTGRIALICQAVSGMVMTQNRLYPDPFEFSGIREYNRTDPMKQINWKASARMGNLMVNQYDSTTSAEVTVFLDTEDTAILKYEALVEESIRIAASLCCRLAQQKMEVKIVSNGLDAETGNMLNYRIAAGAARIHELNRKLARLRTEEKAGLPVPELFREEKGTVGQSHTCIVISKNRSRELEEELCTARKEGMAVLWVLPVLPGRDGQGKTSDCVPVFLWETGK